MNETTVEPTKKPGLFKGRSVITILAAGLLLLLIIVYAVFPLVGLNRLAGRNGFAGGNGRIVQGFNPNNLPSQGSGNGGYFQQGNGNFNPNHLTQGGRSFNANSGLTRVFSILTGAYRITVIVIGLLAIAGIWLKKRWGAILAVILAALAFGLTVPALFRPFFTAFNLISNIAILLLAVGVVVFSILSMRAPKPQAAV